jgi:hypothetical protein
MCTGIIMWWVPEVHGVTFARQLHNTVEMVNISYPVFLRSGTTEILEFNDYVENIHTLVLIKMPPPPPLGGQ